LARVKVDPNGSLDDALRLFTNQVRHSNKLVELRKHEYHVKPGVRKKLKSQEARRNKKKKFF